MTAGDAFGQALLEIAEQGRATPCQGRRRERWTSDRAEERLWAASVCVGLGCVVLLQCHAAADENGEQYHVWGRRRPDTAACLEEEVSVTTSSSARGVNRGDRDHGDRDRDRGDRDRDRDRDDEQQQHRSARGVQGATRGNLTRATTPAATTPRHAPRTTPGMTLLTRIRSRQW